MFGDDDSTRAAPCASDYYCSWRQQCSTTKDLLLLSRPTWAAFWQSKQETCGFTGRITFCVVTSRRGALCVSILIHDSRAPNDSTWSWSECYWTPSREKWTVSPSRHHRIVDSGGVAGVRLSLRVTWSARSIASSVRPACQSSWCFPPLRRVYLVANCPEIDVSYISSRLVSPRNHHAFYGEELEPLLLSSREGSWDFDYVCWKCRPDARSSDRANFWAVSSDECFCATCCDRRRKSTADDWHDDDDQHRLESDDIRYSGTEDSSDHQHFLSLIFDRQRSRVSLSQEKLWKLCLSLLDAAVDKFFCDDELLQLITHLDWSILLRRPCSLVSPMLFHFTSLSNLSRLDSRSDSLVSFQLSLSLLFFFCLLFLRFLFWSMCWVLWFDCTCLCGCIVLCCVEWSGLCVCVSVGVVFFNFDRERTLCVSRVCCQIVRVT